ncbi:shufflon system plasmid conjugative transfer pilus tip adhesin PilV [Dickeya dadantii]|uniref:shufflon system plasmid conjugative transfer pilus tip adhesin PilV n=1 Tax=Dickeya dadantii TaxID=204038 RepID=UPI001C0D903B|nr:shufflon system plasmid conjugative transfer pilus tip adhesin PilV [Dickeya dadantii]QWT41732.1 shufflon system plasmid conjugative transfer pilus tip adhesin PilV [Dickeya dadantii]
MKKQNDKGFSLLELVLVLGVGSAMAFVRFQDMKNEQENVIAKAVGQQIKQMGDAVNGYINIRYDKLSTLTASSSQSSDPGPRTCNSIGCEITYQTLINEGLLPASYTGINAQKSSYKIILKRSGNVPNYIINGLITTTMPWLEGSSFRYDLLGKAMQEAGVDSGMTQSATVASGLQGAWKEISSDFSNINSAGLLAYRVGYDSSMYSVYLRRDGTLPMTGALNMGGNDINNAKDITATGSGTFGKTIATNGLSADDFPSDWAGGVRTVDILANGSLGILKNGKSSSSPDFAFRVNNEGNTTVAGYINASGNIYSENSIVANGSVYAKNTIYALGSDNKMKAYLNSDGSVYASGNLQSDGNINANGNINSYSQITSSKRLTTGEFLQINGTVSAGNPCVSNGLVGRDTSGKILSCVNGVWSSLGGTSKNISLYQCSYNICDNNSASTCTGQISTQNYCQCRAGGEAISCPYIGKLITD